MLATTYDFITPQAEDQIKHYVNTRINPSLYSQIGDHVPTVCVTINSICNDWLAKVREKIEIDPKSSFRSVDVETLRVDHAGTDLIKEIFHSATKINVFFETGTFRSSVGENQFGPGILRFTPHKSINPSFAVQLSWRPENDLLYPKVMPIFPPDRRSALNVFTALGVLPEPIKNNNEALKDMLQIAALLEKEDLKKHVQCHLLELDSIKVPSDEISPDAYIDLLIIAAKYSLENAIKKLIGAINSNSTAVVL